MPIKHGAETKTEPRVAHPNQCLALNSLLHKHLGIYPYPYYVIHFPPNFTTSPS